MPSIRICPLTSLPLNRLPETYSRDATIDQKIATGFHRTPTCNVEAGVHPEENRVNQVFDRVNATGTTWLGTTMECAQCHSHKYDPFSQEEYFQMFAFFNNTPLEVENKSGRGVSYDFWGPKMELPLPADKQKQRDTLNAELEVKKRSLPPCKRKLIGITKVDSAKIGRNSSSGVRVASAHSRKGSFGWWGKFANR